MESNDLKELMDRYLTGTASGEERAQLLSLLDAEGSSAALDLILLESFKDGRFTGEENPEIRQAIHQFLQGKIKPKKVVHMGRWLAAASIVLALGFTSYFVFFNKRSEIPNPKSEMVAHDLPAPQDNKATITLSDGHKIILDSAANGTLVNEGNTKLEKLSDGQIAYTSLTTDHSPLTYNTLFNPRGSRVISLTLSDGTRVWLNSESSLRYPTAFNANERKVEITGEAYFEVAHDAAKPFIVSKGETEVTVLGTHFNVNAYNDEADIKVTLLQGSVKVSRLISHDSQVIKPGEQAVLNTSTNQPINVINNADLDQVMAWKDGFFQFDNSGIKELMQQLARWYDIDIVYEGKVTNREFGGRINRDQTLSSVLKAFEAKDIHFTIEGRKLIVRP